MNNQARKILCEIIQKKGQTFFKNEKEFRALFDDLCHGEYKKERRCINDSILEAVPDSLLKKYHDIPSGTLFTQLTDRLINFGFDPELARWTVESWALAFDLIDEKTLAPEYSTLTLASNPAGADVFLDEKYLGITPIELSDIRAGQYTVKVFSPGCKPWQEAIDLPKGQKKTIHANLIREITGGEVLIDSNPQGAEIHLDSHYRGVTPLKITDLLPGDHAITYRKSGFQTIVRNVIIHKGKNSDVVQNLTAIEKPRRPVNTTFAIDSYPSNAKVFLDGKYSGRTPLIFPKFTPGSYHLKLQLSGFSDYSSMTHVSQGESTDIFWRFEKSSTLLSQFVTYGIAAVITVAIIFLFIGYPPNVGTPSDDQTPPSTTTSGTDPRLNFVFLAEGNIMSDYLPWGVEKTYYFDVGNPERIRFIRIRVEGTSDHDFIVARGYVPTFVPSRYDQIANIGLLSEEIDISDLQQGTYFVTVKNKGQDPAFTITKTTFYQ